MRITHWCVPKDLIFTTHQSLIFIRGRSLSYEWCLMACGERVYPTIPVFAVVSVRPRMIFTADVVTFGESINWN